MASAIRGALRLLKALLPITPAGTRGSASATMPPTRISHTPFGDRAYVTAGSGTPTVVFESGLGDGKEVWGPVFRSLSKHARVVAYDRAGYGQSSDSTEVRDGLQIVKELRAMLQTENMPAPYILVGHSLGGTVVKLFARMYPDEVAGVVLVDARAADFSKRCRHFGVKRMLYEPPLSWLMWGRSAARRELQAAPETQRQARHAGTFPHVPLMVLTHRGFQWPKSIAKVWASSQRSMSRMSRHGHIKVCDDSGHHVHRDRPDLVAGAVLSVLNAARDIRSAHLL